MRCFLSVLVRLFVFIFGVYGFGGEGTIGEMGGLKGTKSTYGPSVQVKTWAKPQARTWASASARFIFMETVYTNGKIP